MNLKDRLPQGKNEAGQSRRTGNLTDTMPISKQPSREQELLSKAQDTIRELTATVSSLSDQLEREKTRNAEAVEKMSALSSQNSTLRSSVQELSLENENLKTLSDDLREQVNLSNVEAVISAQKSKEKTE